MNNKRNNMNQIKIKLLEDNISDLEGQALEAAGKKDYRELSRLGMLIEINMMMIEKLKKAQGEK